MKKIKLFLLLILIFTTSLILVACGNKFKVTNLSTTLVNEDLVCVEKNDLWGYDTIKGVNIIGYAYESADVFRDGYAIVYSDYHYYAINKKAERVTNEYYRLKYLGSDLFAYYSNMKYGFEKAGKEVLTDAIYENISEVNDGMVLVEKGGKYGLINLKFKQIIDFEYDYLEFLPDGYIKARNDDKVGVIDRKGNVVIELKYSSVVYALDGLFKVTLSDNDSIVNKKGKVIYTAPTTFSIVDYSFNSKYAVIQNKSGGRCNLVKTDGTELLKGFSSIFIDKIGSDYFFICLNKDTEENLVSCEIYDSKIKQVGSSSSFAKDYRFDSYYHDYATGYYYFRIIDDGGTSVVHVFKGKKMEIADIATTQYIKQISNGIITLISDSGVQSLMNTNSISLNIDGFKEISIVTTDGYIIYSNGSYYGVSDLNGKVLMNPVYQAIKYDYALK